MPELPDRPDLDQLRRQARELLRAAIDGQPQALARLRAVSERLTLSAAQLAVAREHGFASWPRLRAEAEHRRRLAQPATAAAFPDRWSLGGGADLEIAAGVLSLGGMVISPERAVLEASLRPAAETARRLATADGRHHEPHFDDVIITDDQGTHYALSISEMSSGPPGDGRAPVWMRLELDPVPPRACGWLELRRPDRPPARLLPSARPAVRVRRLGAAADSPAEPELPAAASHLMRLHLAGAGEPPAGDLPPGWPGVIAAAPRADGPAHHLDIAAELPPIGDITLHLDSLISGPQTWLIYLRARPRWWIRSADGSRKRDAASVRARDDVGGLYLSDFGGSTGHADYEELALRFRPRLDPLARAVRLTFSGAGDGDSGGVAVDLSLPPAAAP
jgi:hypothetical protein